MKIEKISDNQIRCCLTKEDLAERQIQLSELAYGSEKARALFRDMMIQANKEYGFTNDANIPLMIEAIPQRENALVVMITKVEDPEELDTRFAKFSASNVLPDDETPAIGGADDILDTFRKYVDKKSQKPSRSDEAASHPSGAAKTPAAGGNGKKRTASDASDARAAGGPAPVMTRLYSFLSLDDVIGAAAALRGFYRGKNTLFHLEKEKRYLLVIHQSAHTPEEYNKICNILSEYGAPVRYAAATEAYYTEHGHAVIAHSALQELAALKG